MAEAEAEAEAGAVAGAGAGAVAVAVAGAGAGAGADVVMAEAGVALEQAACGICFDAPEPPESLAALRCGHTYCTGCWGELLRHSLEAGGKGLLACCPQPGCAEPVCGEAWAAWLPPSAAPLLRRLKLRSFVEGNTLLCWCPSRGCNPTRQGRLQPHAPQRLQPLHAGAPVRAARARSLS